jgi:hypothetical protein
VANWAPYQIQTNLHRGFITTPTISHPGASSSAEKAVVRRLRVGSGSKEK